MRINENEENSRVLECLRALAEPQRMRLVQTIASHGELCVCQLTEILRRSEATTSRHLSQLHRAGLLNLRREATWAYYSLNSAMFESLSRIFMDWARLANNPLSPSKKEILVCQKLKS